MIRCKLSVASIKKYVVTPWNDGKPSTPIVAREVTFQAVSAQEGEDSIFGKATPSVSFTALIYNEAAGEEFEAALGKKFYCDFTPTE